MQLCEEQLWQLWSVLQRTNVILFYLLYISSTCCLRPTAHYRCGYTDTYVLHAVWSPSLAYVSFPSFTKPASSLMTGLPLSLCLVCFPQLVVIIADLCLHFLDLKGLLAFKSVTLHCMNMGVFIFGI